MGFPGQLPMLNQKAVEKGIISGLALGCQIPEFSKFDRKNYFYPDSPKGYQITQFDKPISINGKVTIETEAGEKEIRVNRMHLEDDAGKLTHTPAGSLVDFNRAGTPLMEIVSEPDIRSVEEASLYAREIQKIVRYAKTSDADMEKGMMRFDLNISLRPEGQEEFGTKVEIKNLNSFQSLEKAAQFEIKRQSKMLDNSEEIHQETRGWDDKTEKTVSQRSKEEAMDYRYFPEPDLPPVHAEEQTVAELRKLVPELPYDKKKRFEQEYQLLPDDIRILTENPDLADFFETAAKIGGNAKTACSFINTVLMAHLKEDQLDIKDSKVTAEHIGELVKLVEEGTISNNVAKSTVFEEMYDTGKTPTEIVEEKGLKQVSDTSALEDFAKKAIEALPQAADDVRAGEMKAIGALVGFVMKESKGQANPKAVNEILQKLLS
jgi:aspartyl-tRNA(Asn)/glutamyl-tRNA(Gln) amidotransferase subunit B